jgi:pimeloyl-ACP methyl ester carboxylesterase
VAVDQPVGGQHAAQEGRAGDLAEVLRLMDCANRYDRWIDHPTWQVIRQRMLETDEIVKASLQRSNDSYRDPRVRGAYVMSPGLATALDSASLADVSVPVRFVTGDADDQVFLDAHVRPLAKAVPGATLDVLPGMGHYVFLAPCDLQGRLFVRNLCRDAGAKRKEMHRRIGKDAMAFFTDVFDARNEQE